MTKDQVQELDYLRFFYHKASVGMGPASDDIYEYIKEEYRSNGGIVPARYMPEEEEDNG